MGRCLRRGLGYLFDSTLGYPGEGPSHIPPHRREIRPALRLWSTRRPVRASSESHQTPPVLNDGQAPVKRDHGNSDTGLGRWLHAARSHHRQYSAQTDNTRRRPTPNSSRDIAPSSPSLLQRREEQQSFGPVQVDASATPEEKPQPVLNRTTRTEGTGHPTQLDCSTPSTTLPESDSEPIDRRGFIRTFAKRQGVSTSSLEAIWRSNKHGYKVAYDAPFARFQQFFREVKPDCSFSPEHILPGDLVSFLEREHVNGATFASLKDASTSISMACREATDGNIALGDKDSVKRFLKSVRIHEPVGHRKQIVPNYHDVSALFQEAWDFGPNECLCEGNLKEKLIILLMVDSAARPSDIHRLFRTMTGRHSQIRFEANDMLIRYFWSKEVDPGSSRSNSTNTYFSKWVKIHGTVPKCTDTVETMKAFLQRTSDPELYATVFIPELQLASQPLVYAQWQHGRLQQASVDHISNIVKRAIKDRKMGRMMTAHIRGASVSKIVQLVPALTDQALALGRWTTPNTFRNHYQAPVLGTWAKVPKTICNNPQQVLRWGWTPQPPAGISITEYEKPPSYWVGKTIPSLGKVAKFENGDYMVNDLALKHWEFMSLVSETRSTVFTV